MLVNILIKTCYDYLRIFPFILLAHILIYFLRRFKIKKYVNKIKNKKGVSFLLGIFSHGSIFLWYPLLQELEFSERDLLIFFYLRGIKIPHIPLQVMLLGWKLTLLINLYIILISLLMMI